MSNLFIARFHVSIVDLLHTQDDMRILVQNGARTCICKTAMLGLESILHSDSSAYLETIEHLEQSSKKINIRKMERKNVRFWIEIEKMSWQISYIM